jgi:hypothetical protein
MSIPDLPKASPTAQAREDFIKRLFAVTLSVGIANQLSRVVGDPTALVNHHIVWHPIFEKWRELLLLFISLTIVVSSWEGYLGAVLRSPLEDLGRFSVDILVVFTYLLMTLATEDADAWFVIHVIVFGEYLVWDLLRMRLASFKPRARLYESSLLITLIWMIYFIIILYIKLYFTYFDGDVGFVAISASVLLGVFLYRSDKIYRERWTWAVKSAATLAPIVVLLLLRMAEFRIG